MEENINSLAGLYIFLRWNYDGYMVWSIITHEAFDTWLLTQPEDVQVSVLAHAELLAEFGPTLGQPYVDTVKGSRHSNMKELRVQHGGDPFRVLFAYDPDRRAILLLGGNKRGNKRWYKVNIPLADKRLDQHLRSLLREKGK